MRRSLALVGAAFIAVAGVAVLGPPAAAVQPSLAAGFAPQDTRLQLLAARDSFASETPNSKSLASAYALRSLQAMPYNQPALSVAIESNALAKRVEAANVAAALGWRDALANARIGQLALEQNAPEIAAQRVDAIGRTQGGEFAAAAADLLVARSGGPEALAARAANRSGGRWWIAYLHTPAKNPQVIAGRLAFARSLDADDGPWRRTIITTVIAGLQHQTAAADGFALWRATLADPRAFEGVLYDPQFARMDAARPAAGGEWQMPSTSPFRSEDNGLGTGNGVSLAPVSRSAGVVLTQDFVAPAGRYRVHVEGEDRTGRLAWTIGCKGSSPFFTSEGAVGEWTVRVPEGCAVASLQLRARKGPAEGSLDQLAHIRMEPES
ncbi:hypothetical protein ACXYL9_00640 [Qipengyuania sp. CAU 1752]